jgi:hypothetical protein
MGPGSPRRTLAPFWHGKNVRYVRLLFTFWRLYLRHPVSTFNKVAGWGGLARAADSCRPPRYPKCYGRKESEQEPRRDLQLLAAPHLFDTAHAGL